MAAPYQTPFYSTQGVQLFGLNQLTSPAAVMTVGASMGFDNVGGAADSINITNLDSPGFKEYFKGLVDPGSPGGDVVFNFQSVSHAWLDTMLIQSQNGTTQWFLAAADAATTVLPTVTGTLASGNLLLKPANSVSSPHTWSRSGFWFYGFVKEFSKGVQVNSFIKAKLKLQVTGQIYNIIKGAAATTLG